MAGIYIHIPFCSKFCSYCSFYSVGQLSLRNSFVQALCNEISARSREFFASGKSWREEACTTLYFGGGTPSVMEESSFTATVDSLRSHFDLSYLEEFTVEVNPNDVTERFASFLKSLGVSRVSMGIQSFNDTHLKWMNRRHSAAQAVEAFHTLRSAGFSNISCDLIFGFPGLTVSEWLESIHELVALGPEHISCYQMSVERGTPLALSQVEMPSQEECANQYSMLQRELAAAGYGQYEISNFALAGYESRHNSSYWNGAPYLGFGPGAHSYSGIVPAKGSELAEAAYAKAGKSSQPVVQAVRSWNVPVLKRYLEYWNEECGAGGGESEPVSRKVRGSEHLTPRDCFNEILMLGLRQTRGIRKSDLEASPFYGVVRGEILRQIRLGNLENSANGEYLRIPASKLFISDSIIRELFI